MSNYFERGVKGSAIVFVFTFLANVFGYLTRLFLARVLSPDDFGLFYSAFTLFMFLSIFTELGYNSSLVKYIPHYLATKEYNNVKKTMLYVLCIETILTIFSVVVIWLLSEVIATNYFKDIKSITVIYLFIIAIVFNNMSGYLMHLFQGFQDMFRNGLIYFLSKFLLFFSCIFLYYLTGLQNSLLPTYAFLLSGIIPLFIFSGWFFKRFCEFKLKEGFDFQFFKKISSFSVFTLLNAVAGLIIGYIDTIMLTYFTTLTIVGIYNSVLATALIIGIFSSVIGTALFPMVAEIWAKNEQDKLKYAVSEIYNYCLIIVIPAAMIMFIYPEIILRVLFGESFILGTKALKIIALGTIFLSIAQVNFTVMNGIGKPKEVTKIMAVSALFNTIGNVIFIPIYGMNGAAMTTTISYLIMLMASYFRIQKYVRFELKNIAKIIIATMIFLSCLFILKQNLHITNAYVKVFSSLIFCCIIYLLLIVKLRIINFEKITRIFAKF